MEEIEPRENDANFFDYKKHVSRNREMLKKIGQEFNKVRPKVVALKHQDGRVVVVNADRADSAFQSWTRQGFAVQEHEKHLLETAVPNTATPELRAATEKAAFLEDTLRSQNEKHDAEMAALNAKLDALLKSQTGKAK